MERMKYSLLFFQRLYLVKIRRERNGRSFLAKTFTAIPSNLYLLRFFKGETVGIPSEKARGNTVQRRQVAESEVRRTDFGGLSFRDILCRCLSLSLFEVALVHSFCYALFTFSASSSSLIPPLTYRLLKVLQSAALKEWQFLDGQSKTVATTADILPRQLSNTIEQEVPISLSREHVERKVLENNDPLIAVRALSSLFSFSLFLFTFLSRVDKREKREDV